MMKDQIGMTPLEEKELMQKYFIRKYGKRNTVLDVVIKELKVLEKTRK